MENTATLGQLGTTFDTIIDLMLGVIGSFVELIVSNPYLLIGVSLMLIGAGVSFLKRLIRV